MNNGQTNNARFDRRVLQPIWISNVTVHVSSKFFIVNDNAVTFSEEERLSSGIGRTGIGPPVKRTAGTTIRFTLGEGETL
jgi:hypothetical protein